MPKKPGKMQQYRGFLCHAGASTAACVPGDPRSVVVPRRPDRTLLVDHSRVHDLRYSRLVDTKRFTASMIPRPPSPPPPPPPAAVFAGSLNKEVRPAPPAARKKVVEKLAPARRNVGVAASCKPKTRATDFALRPPPLPATATAAPQPPPTHGDVFQVVVMKVSLHCQGCACKVKKHISKMEGVTSFSIDLESKRVTVMGHISPAGVLESISKVKKAEFWQQHHHQPQQEQ